MTTNTMMNQDSMTNSDTNTAIRVTRALIGFSLIIPVVAGLGISPWMAFGLSMVGGCMIFTSLITSTTAGGVAGCTASLAMMGLVLFNASALVNPVSIAVMSLSGIAVVTIGLIGSKLPQAAEKAPTLQLLKAHIEEVTNVNQAINDNRKKAA